MKLYSYWRSTAAYRVRIGLNLKGLSADMAPIHLMRDGGEQLKPAYRLINANAVVPALELDDGVVLTQSLAIIEYLEERYPTPPLLPSEIVARARVRAAAQLIACDIHPINNLRVVGYLKGRLGHSQDEAIAWMRHWMRQGLEAYDRTIDREGRFSFGDLPTLADLCLIPQLYNATRWGLDVTGLGRLQSISHACSELPAFQSAMPERQPDAE